LTFALGVIPPVLLMARRPEDMGLEPDPAPNKPVESVSAVAESESPSPAAVTEPSYTESSFTVRQAFHTRAFWLLAAFTAAGFMVQGGLSLHQVAHYINQGLPGPTAALAASTFAFSQIFSAMFWAALGRRIPVRFLLSATAAIVAVAAFGTSVSATLPAELVSAATVGFGVGGLHLLVRLAWADYYGREHLGTIRGYTMSAQIGGQAIGPVLAGFMFDATGSYQMPFLVFTGAATLAAILALFATPPKLSALTQEPAGRTA